MEQENRRRSPTELPEFNVLIFALLLNYPWELIQVPLYEGMAAAPHWEAVKVCTRATLGDGLIMLVSYWSAAAVVRNRSWVLRPTAIALLVLLSTGVAITVLLERLAIVSSDPAWGWRYAEAMPLVPVLGIGLTPLLQWIVLPLLMVWFVKRQLAGTSAL